MFNRLNIHESLKQAVELYLISGINMMEGVHINDLCPCVRPPTLDSNMIETVEGGMG